MAHFQLVVKGNDWNLSKVLIDQTWLIACLVTPKFKIILEDFSVKALHNDIEY